MNIGAMITKLKQHSFFSEFLTSKTLAQFVRYAITGVLSAGTEFLILYILGHSFKVWYIYAHSASYIVGFWLNFLINKFWSFKSRENFLRQILLFLSLFGVNFLLTNGIMYFFTDVLGFYFMVSKIFSIGLITLWNFALYKKVIYK